MSKIDVFAFCLRLCLPFKFLPCLENNTAFQNYENNTSRNVIFSHLKLSGNMRDYYLNFESANLDSCFHSILILRRIGENKHCVFTGF